LDTSVISYLFAEDTLEKMNDTLSLWNDLINDKHDIFISPVVINEIRNKKMFRTKAKHDV